MDGNAIVAFVFRQKVEHLLVFSKRHVLANGFDISGKAISPASGRTGDAARRISVVVGEGGDGDAVVRLSRCGDRQGA